MARCASLVPAVALVLFLTLSASAQAPANRSEALPGRSEAPPVGQVTFAATVTLAPTWFDPAETPGVITPFLTLYALHDALTFQTVWQPLPGGL